MPTRKDMHRSRDNLPLAYFLTLRTYGTWLHGNDRGSVDQHQNQYGTPRVAAHSGKQKSDEARMKDPPMLLAAESAALVESVIAQVCAHRQWHHWIAKARTNHVHVVVKAVLTPERMMNDFK